MAVLDYSRLYGILDVEDRWSAFLQMQSRLL